MEDQWNPDVQLSGKTFIDVCGVKLGPLARSLHLCLWESTFWVMLFTQRNYLCNKKIFKHKGTSQHSKWVQKMHPNIQKVQL